MPTIQEMSTKETSGHSRNALKPGNVQYIAEVRESKSEIEQTPIARPKQPPVREA